MLIFQIIWLMRAISCRISQPSNREIRFHINLLHQNVKTKRTQKSSKCILRQVLGV